MLPLNSTQWLNIFTLTITMSESAYSNKAFKKIILLIFTFIKYSLSFQELKVVLQL